MPEIVEPRGANGASPAMREMAADDDRSIKEWMDALAGDGSLRVQISRKKPSVGPNGEAIAGILETVEDRIDDDYLRDTWGGGVFQLKIFRHNAQGNWVYLRSRTISIAGPPKMAGVSLTPGGGMGAGAVAPIPVAAGGDDLVDRAMTALERSTQRAEARMERLEAERQKPGMDLSALDAVLGPIREELAASRAESRELRQQLYAATTKAPPRDEFRDRLMERMIDGESARVESVRAQYEARIDRMRDAHVEEIKRIETRHEDVLRRLEKQHERAVDGVEKTLDERTAGLKLGYEMRIDTLKAQIAALERDLAGAASKVSALEARKDQSLPDKAQELMQIREALDGLGGGAGGDGDRPWYERAIDALGNSEALLALVNKVGGGGAVEEQPVALPPPGVPFRGPDGQVYVVGPDGRPHLAQRRLAAAKARKRQLAAPAPPARNKPRLQPMDGGLAGTPRPEPESAILEDEDVAGGAGDEASAVEQGLEAPAIRAPDAKEVKLAVVFMENALRNNTAPEQFASSFRTLVPADVLRFIQAVGIDEFLNKVVEPMSPLATQRGRQFARTVSKVMIEGSAG